MTGAQRSFLPGADLAAVAPALRGRFEVVLWDTSWRLNSPQTVGGTEYSCLGIDQSVFLAACYLCSAFWSQGGVEHTGDAYKTSLLYKSECLTPDAVPTKLQSMDVSALFSLFETYFFFFSFHSVGPEIFLLGYTATTKTQ